MATTTETYRGNCHCGQVRFSFVYAPLESTQIMWCNCSICTKNGYLLVYPKATDVQFTSGQDAMREYRFGNRMKPRKFCGNCSTSILIDFAQSSFEKEREYLAINVRFTQITTCYYLYARGLTLL